MSQFKEIDAALAARAKEFDQDLQMGPALPEVEAELFAALTRDLPAAPASWFTNQIAALVAKPAEAADLVRALLVERMQAIGEAAGVALVHTEAPPAWPFDESTGAPLAEHPITNLKLAEALFAAGRQQRVHPLCSRAQGAARCDCPDHSPACPGRKPRLKDWRKRATTKADLLSSWWAKWPDAEVGLAGGSLTMRSGSGPAQTERRRAKQFLAGMLDEEGVPVRIVEAEAREQGFSKATIERAKVEMGIKSRQMPGGGWEWYWPLDKQPDPSAVNDDAGTVALMGQFLAGT